MLTPEFGAKDAKKDDTGGGWASTKNTSDQLGSQRMFYYGGGVHDDL
jgi:hypothetical protein